MKIRELFDETRKIDRKIEKVVTYSNKEENLLKQEINEYVVTENIENSLSKMLESLDSSGMGSSGSETCFWVSGFYGSGKSSLTKYLGFALDPSIQIQNKPFLNYLADQINNASTKSRLKTVAKNNPMTIFMLDLAVQQENLTVSSLLYWNVMQWVGYSKEMKIAYLERMLEEDNKYESFQKEVVNASGGKTWSEIKQKPLLIKTYASRIAIEFYPNLWKTEKQFNDIKIEEFVSEEDKVKQILQLIERKTNRKNVLFILDEAGQYVASREDLIMNLDGLAKNIKRIGGGNAFLMATAQQTLTEADPRISYNTANLYKLKDRFPISIHLEADDIKEITSKRLLTKSTIGIEKLKELFLQYGAKLKLSTQLINLKQYNQQFSEKEFCELYPFLPQQIFMTLCFTI